MGQLLGGSEKGQSTAPDQGPQAQPQKAGPGGVSPGPSATPGRLSPSGLRKALSLIPDQISWMVT